MNAKISILLIEDNLGDVNLIKLQLESSSLKYKFFHTDTFFDGINIIKENDISIVLLDLSLPDTTGFKTLSSFLEKKVNIPVIVLTGIKNEIIENQAVKAGAQDYLVKGQFDGKLLGRSIRYAIQRFKTQMKLEESTRNLVLSEKRYIDAQEMARFGNWEMDIVSNSMKWSDEIFRIFGFHPNKFSPSLSDYMSYVHMEDKTAVEDFFENAATDGKLYQLEHRILIDGRTIKHLSIRAKVHYEEINNKILLIGSIQDITQRKISEQLIIEKNITQKASKIKEEALADMSFHIRTPLSSVVNLLYLLQNTSTSSQQKEYLDGLKTSVDDLSIMINNLLNFSVLASEKIKIDAEPFNIRDFIQSIQKVVQIKADNSKIQIKFDIAENLPENLISDHNKIAQILYNLLNNCMSLVEKNGKIQIAVSFDDTNNESPMLGFNIHHNGETLSKEKIKQLMEADKILEDYDIEEESRKQQLGSAIVSTLTKTLKGELGISSTVPNGTNYNINIPIEVVKKRVASGSGKLETPLRILLVEDHFLNQIATKKLLLTWSDFVSVDIAENGLIAVEKYREHGYDLVLMDLQMPVMNGIDAAKKIREKSEVPIIALTANSSKQEANRCVETGMNDYLAKPFKPQDLFTKILESMVVVEG